MTRKPRKKMTLKRFIKETVAGLILGGIIVYVLYSSNLWKPLVNKIVFSNIPVSAAESDNGFRHSYETLDEDSKSVYAILMQKISTMPEKIAVPYIDSENYDDAYCALINDNPDLFFLTGVYQYGIERYVMYILPQYAFSASEYEKRNAEVKNVADKLIEKATLKKTDYDKELYIHDWIVSHCTYDDTDPEGDVSTVYGCLVNRKATCSGYTGAFRYLLNRLGIDNYVAFGKGSQNTDLKSSEKSSEEDVLHTWNIVIIDGQAYHTDVTWDDPKDSETVTNHQYFNLTTEQISVDHKDIFPEELPVCKATDYNYFVYEKTYFKNAEKEAIRKNVKEAIIKAKKMNYDNLQLKFSSEKVMDVSIKVLADDELIHDIYYDAGIEVKNNTITYYTDDVNNIASFIF